MTDADGNDNAAAAVKAAGPIAIPGVLRALLRYAPLVILALAWEAASRLHLVSALALPPLSDVAAAWVELARSGELAGNAAARDEQPVAPTLELCNGTLDLGAGAGEESEVLAGDEEGRRHRADARSRL